MGAGGGDSSPAHLLQVFKRRPHKGSSGVQVLHLGLRIIYFSGENYARAFCAHFPPSFLRVELFTFSPWAAPEAAPGLPPSRTLAQATSPLPSRAHLGMDLGRLGVPFWGAQGVHWAHYCTAYGKRQGQAKCAQSFAPNFLPFRATPPPPPKPPPPPERGTGGGDKGRREGEQGSKHRLETRVPGTPE